MPIPRTKIAMNKWGWVPHHQRNLRMNMLKAHSFSNIDLHIVFACFPMSAADWFNDGETVAVISVLGADIFSVPDWCCCTRSSSADDCMVQWLEICRLWDQMDFLRNACGWMYVFLASSIQLIVVCVPNCAYRLLADISSHHTYISNIIFSKLFCKKIQKISSAIAIVSLASCGWMRLRWVTHRDREDTSRGRERSSILA